MTDRESRGRRVHRTRVYVPAVLGRAQCQGRALSIRSVAANGSGRWSVTWCWRYYLGLLSISADLHYPPPGLLVVSRAGGGGGGGRTGVSLAH